MFTPNDKVVCVDDSFDPNGWVAYFGLEPPLKVGEIYCVRCSFESINGDSAVYLTGVNMPIHPKYGRECGFYASRFRLVSEVKMILAIYNKEESKQPQTTKP